MQRAQALYYKRKDSRQYRLNVWRLLTRQLLKNYLFKLLNALFHMIDFLSFPEKAYTFFLVL